MDDAVKRAVKKCLKDNGFDANIVDELIVERKTIRDDLAREAMGALIRNHIASHKSTQEIIEHVSRIAYEQADMMLFQREVRH